MAVSSKNSGSPTSSTSPASNANHSIGFTARRRLIAGLWASSLVALHAAATLAQSLGAVATDAKAFQCGPIGDTIEYILWLLQQL